MSCGDQAGAARELAAPEGLSRGSALYAGAVIHARLRPRKHRLRYRLFSLLVDLDELPALDKRLRLFAHNRFNLFSLHDADYGRGDGTPLKAYAEEVMRQAGLAPDGGAIRLLTMPRLFGYAFNPLSIYFCHRADGTLAALLYEVNNTFGQRHSYFIPVAPGEGTGGMVRQSAAKCFYVSPFMDMGLDYAFRVEPPGEAFTVAITAHDHEGPVLVAAHRAHRRPLTDGTLARALFSYPLLTLKVMAGIHWEALFIWAKGIGLRRRPPPPADAVSLPAVPLPGPLATVPLPSTPQTPRIVHAD
ncbi:DUF1365 family protein [Ancylobacter sp. WKF20]|uniref:DUF1365 domain-containing protein n=1 Tax=Ancylobacter sp. WKF20 TaxID=3039801 RepID=UPI0024342AB9|nr:DUF1365 family protein [Ancylobacter sp. WKF20]WGD29315.1 DUF1365 family protein [Ancylobacter sp. WKF20]